MKKCRLAALFAFTNFLMAQGPATANYDEALAGKLPLPLPLKTNKGKAIRTVKEWNTLRRPELLDLFATHMHGRLDLPLQAEKTETLGSGSFAEYRGKWRETRLWVGQRAIHVLTVLPATTSKPVPVFIGLNYRGNQAVMDEPGIRINEHWMNKSYEGVVNERATEKTRGKEMSRWPAEMIIDSGFGFITAYYGDFHPDHKEGRADSILPARASGGAIAAWAWGLRMLRQHASEQIDIDAKRSIAIGHSRLGKAAVWAAAQEEGFAGLVSNNSGEGGAALSRRNIGETIADLNRSFPWWFAAQYREYDGHPEKLPVDSHLLLSLVAPRLVYVASATEDRWADPRGEYQALLETAPVFRLFGKEALAQQPWPAAGQPLSATATGYHLRAGRHDIQAEDWKHFLRFFGERLR
jgi:hypothetical protein